MPHKQPHTDRRAELAIPARDIDGNVGMMGGIKFATNDRQAVRSVDDYGRIVRAWSGGVSARAPSERYHGRGLLSLIVHQGLGRAIALHHTAPPSATSAGIRNYRAILTRTAQP